MNFDEELTLLSDGQIWGNNNESQLKVIRKYGTKAAITDLCVLTGCYAWKDTAHHTLTGCFWTSSGDGNDVCAVYVDGSRHCAFRFRRTLIIRPILQSSKIFSLIFPNKVRGYNGTKVVEYGEYPQNVADSRMQNILESNYNYRDRALNKTGGSYTFDSVGADEHEIGFKPVTYEEYEYQGKKYIRIKVNSNLVVAFKLLNGDIYMSGDYVWVEVSPVKWLIDKRTKTLVSEVGLLSGIRYSAYNRGYDGDFSNTEMKEFLDKYMLRDLTQTVTLAHIQNMVPVEKNQFEEEHKQKKQKVKKKQLMVR